MNTDSKKLDAWQLKIRRGIQRLQSAYHRDPLVFMTEGDVECALYSEIVKSFLKATKTKVKDCQNNVLNGNEYNVLTRPIHSELSFKRPRKGSGYVDLSLFDPSDVQTCVKREKFDRTEGKFSVWNWDWEPSETIGIEIKFNRWISKTKAYSHETRRTRETKKWRNYRSSLVRDLKKLRQYKRGWLVFVDHYTLFDSRDDWKNFADSIIRHSNYGGAKKTLNAYYLAPGCKKARPFKPHGKSF